MCWTNPLVGTDTRGLYKSQRSTACKISACKNRRRVVMRPWALSARIASLKLQPLKCRAFSDFRHNSTGLPGSTDGVL